MAMPTSLVKKGPPYTLDDRVVRVRGIGPSWAAELEERGVRSVADLVDHLPFRYEDRRCPRPLAELQAGEVATVIGLVREQKRIRTRRRGMQLLTFLIDDGTASVPVTFFNRSYLGDVVAEGTRVLLHGAPRLGKRGLEFGNPEFDVLEPGEDPRDATGWVPVYEKLGPLSPRRLRAVTRELLSGLVAVPDPLPPELLARHGFPDRRGALFGAHRPAASTPPEEIAARRTPALRRLAFDEFFYLELGLAIRRRRRQRERRGLAYRIDAALLDEVRAVLPFTLTGAQARTLDELVGDLAAEWPMNRLLLGDVGSGKTAIALLAMLMAERNGHQAALMAPTEILANQHARKLQEVLPWGLNVELLTAGLPAARQRVARERIATGQARIIVGTHSLISEKVSFSRLGLVVIDEQHRFGVLQRADLVAKGVHPDVLVMSATPIPRTLAMVLYGDLDVSILDEKPPGRVPIRTFVRTHAQRERVMHGLEVALAARRRVYVVRPAVDEGTRGRKAAEQGLTEYRERFPGTSVALVHGRMPAAERQANLEAFTRGDVQVLVATTVIEVGIDVAEASVIVVEDADRFGLAQLHQLRGRVGRGDQRSYCVLVASEEASPEALERLHVLERTLDGFRVAERDLELRGPGELAGTAQSGAPNFHVADLVRHQDLLLAARAAAFEIVERGGEHGVPPELRHEALRRYGETLRLVEIG